MVHFDKWQEKIQKYALLKQIPARTVVLREGDMTENVYYIIHGCMRLWHNHEGEEITIQFFQEGQLVTSFESFYLQVESRFSLATIEATEVLVLTQSAFERVKKENPELCEAMNRFISERFIAYTNLFLSRIEMKPEQRYRNFCKNNQDLLERVPHHMIASYLGMTPISLSRIRSRIQKEQNLP